MARLTSTWLPPLAWMAVIFAFSTRHGGDHLATAEVVLRKLAHVTEYFALTALLVRALRRSQIAAAVPASVVAALAYASSDEWHQSFVPGRTATPRDVAIDGVGIALAAIVVTRTRLRERMA
ncbi:MAG: VanZ family protein [Actinomycetota bacterium]|nr:VanZ family protein [Actinomycetota bacterium]